MRSCTKRRMSKPVTAVYKRMNRHGYNEALKRAGTLTIWRHRAELICCAHQQAEPAMQLLYWQWRSNLKYVARMCWVLLKV